MQGRSHRLGRALGIASVAIGTALVAGIGKAVVTAASFEKVLDQVGAVSDATASQMKALKEEALDLGASTKFSAREVASAEVELAKAGLATSDILGGALKGSLSLAAAGNLELADAATFAANAMNLFGLEGRDVSSIADGLATAANTTTADVEDFGRALTQGGAAAKAAGLSFQDTIVILEALAEAGVKNSDAGTSMKAALIQLINPTAKQARASKDLGLSFITQAGNMKDASDISEMLREKTEGMTRAQRLQLFATIAGTDGVRTLLALYDAGPKKLDKYREGLDDVGSAERTAAKMQDNLAGKLEQLGGAVETLAIRLGDRLIPMLTAGTEKLTDLVTFLGKVADAKSPEVAVRILFAGIRGAAENLVDALRTALMGGTTRKPLKLDSGKIIEWDTRTSEGLVSKLQVAIAKGVDGVDWSKAGKRIGAALSGALVFGSDILDGLIKAIADNVDEIADLGVQIIATMFVKILDPAFWIEHWRLALAVAFAALGLLFTPIKFAKSGILVRAFSGLFIGIPGKIKGFISRIAGDFFRGIGSTAAGAAARGAARLVTRILTFIRQIPPRVERYIAITADAMGRRVGEWVAVGSRLASRLVAAILNGLAGLAAKVLGRLNGVRTAITRIIGTVYGDAKRIGSAIINGIIDGLSGLFSAVSGKITGAVRGAVDWAKGHLGSTAEEYAARQLGAPLAAGVAGGFAGALGDSFATALRGALRGVSLTPAGLPAGASAGGLGGGLVVNLNLKGATFIPGDRTAARDLAKSLSYELKALGLG